MAFELTLVTLLLRSMSGRVDDNHHDFHSWMLEVANGQLLGHMDDGEEKVDEAPEDELNEDEEEPEPCPESQAHAPEAKCVHTETPEQSHREDVKASTGSRALLPGCSPREGR